MSFSFITEKPFHSFMKLLDFGLDESFDLFLIFTDGRSGG